MQGDVESNAQDYAGVGPGSDASSNENTHSPVDTGEVIKSTAELLEQLEQCGNAFNILSYGNTQNSDFARMRAQAATREEDNENVFLGDKDALEKLWDIEDPEILSDIHMQSRNFWRRASTSNKVAHALEEGYSALDDPPSTAAPIAPEKARKQIKELLGVVVSLAEQRAELIASISESYDRYEELVKQHYKDATESVLAEFDVLGMQRKGLSKVHFKKRAQLLSEMKELLAKIEEANERYSMHSFIDIKTRELPTD